MSNINKIKVVVLGGAEVGKSVTVRYLTKRFIGEYSSSSDIFTISCIILLLMVRSFVYRFVMNPVIQRIVNFLYRHSVTFDSVTTEVEIMDTSKCAKTGCLYEHIRWGDAFLVVYSICDKSSFADAEDYLQQLSKLKLPSYYTALLLGNKRDLDHSRTITVNEGQELSLKFACQFYEVSAAESFAGVSLAFQSFLREARSVQLLRALPIRRKLGVNSVSKVLGNIFGKNTKDRKKRPSLSI